MRKNICVSEPIYKWLDGQRKTIQGKYTPAKKESFDVVLERLRMKTDAGFRKLIQDLDRIEKEGKFVSWADAKKELGINEKKE